VFGIVKQHRGAIAVTSAVGRGTTFDVFLPAAPTPAVTAERELVARFTGGNETILLVEDDPMLRRAIDRVLERHGYRVIGADGAASAREAWSRAAGRIDLLLTDLVLSEGANGRALAAELQSRSPDLEVILMSGYGAEVADGAQFLAKPCSPAVLLERVRRCLDQR